MNAAVAGTQDPFAASWHDWQRQRLAAATEPHGPAALTLTAWLSEEPRELPALPGTWRAAGTSIVGSGFAPGEITLPGGEAVTGEAVLDDGVTELRAGERALRRFERDGSLALRIFDPASPGRLGLRAIEAYDPEPRWRLGARFEPGEQRREIELADGYRRTAATSGSLAFELDGEPLRLTGTVGPAGISVVFGDATNGVESYGFRFLTVPLPDDEGRTVVDFTRAYLPPCAFSDQFVCPLPVAENRLAVPIRAGERVVLR
ncbi:DUF1684 domain-containing protein [Leucobacter massiliensis]|uniref:DUF1684 domain-containing protein n=1 Tax=Leucobacter massiliensis TaxID=1686285 RepID=UPI000D009CE8|nr:DUF1684 domain-containing protein [Leucobacter massiliensis]